MSENSAENAIFLLTNLISVEILTVLPYEYIEVEIYTLHILIEAYPPALRQGAYFIGFRLASFGAVLSG